MTRRLLWGCCLVWLIALTLGCETKPTMNYGSLDLVKAGGRITLDGQPLPKAVISFDDADGSFSFGQTDSNGYYKLQFDSEMMGVKPGKKTIRISTKRKILGLNSADEAPAGEGGGEGASESEPAQELVPERYNKKSELTEEVTTSKTTYNFDLKSQ